MNAISRSSGLSVKMISEVSRLSIPGPRVGHKREFKVIRTATDTLVTRKPPPDLLSKLGSHAVMTRYILTQRSTTDASYRASGGPGVS